MRFIFSIILIICTVSVGFTQNQLDENGKKHGLWVGKDKITGNVTFKGEFDHGTPVGEFKKFYPNKKVKAIINYKGDTTVVKSFFERGGVMAYGMYVNEQREGEWKYFSGNGYLISKDNYSKGVKQGKSFVYNEKGQLVEESNYVDGKLDGTYLMLYPNKVEKERKTFKNGVQVGEEIKKYPNNKIMAKGNYVDGYRDGWYVELLPNGNEKVKYKYIKGIADTTIYVNDTFMSVYDTDRIKEVKPYQAGVVHGEHIIYADKLNRRMEVEYDKLLQANKKVLVEEQPIIYKAKYRFGKLVEGPFYYNTKGAEISAEAYDKLFGF